jgi:hypothetical protein
MIVYRDGRLTQDPRVRLRRVRTMARCAVASGGDLEHVRDLLIELGILESGIADAMNPVRDTRTPACRILHDASRRAGRLLVAAESGAAGSERRELGVDLTSCLDGIDTREWPASIAVSDPEGYAYYAVFPEQYVAAALDVAARIAPSHATCIGVRAIGTSLSAAVSAALERRGCRVRSCTVRPRGHPFDRTLALDARLEQWLVAEPDTLFLVVDEGPGLSGSSFAAVASALTRIGVADERIVFLPSWLPDGSAFVNDSARGVWSRHRKASVSFDEHWIASGRLSTAFGGGDIADLSAGAWRERITCACEPWPPVQPQHERRKYLRRKRGEPTALHKFVGLGERGRTACERAHVLADAGFSPRPLQQSNGFLATELVAGRSLAAFAVDEILLERLASYLAFVAREFPAKSATVAPASMLDMVDVNARALLGESDGAAVGRTMRTYASTLENATPIALDGRMLPHEWIAMSGAVLKIDATDHGDDHFFPGPGDIAWDLAGTAVEFRLDDAARRHLTGTYARLTGDDVSGRIAAYELAYLCFRGGYASMAGGNVQDAAERERWNRAARHYRDCLRRSVGALHRAA